MDNNIMMTLDNIQNSNPRKLFIDDLTQAVKEWKTDNDEIIIVMDANEQIGKSGAGLTSLMRDCKLVDLFHHHHGIQPDFTTYERGTRRLDYAIGSATLLPFLTRCGYLPFFQGIQSDHRGLFLDLSHELIDGLTRLERTSSRYLHSEYKTDVYRYKQYVIKEFNSHNIGRKAADLCSLSNPIKREDPVFLLALNELDSLVVSIQLKAEQKCCKRRTKYDWSDDIYYTKRILTFWNLHRKSIKFKRDVTKITKDIYNSLPEPHQQYIDIASDNPVTNWNRTKKHLQILIVQHRTLIATIQRESIDNEIKFTGSSAEQIIKKQEQRKQDKRLYSTLRQHFHPVTRSGIAHVLLPDKDKHGIPTDVADLAETWRTETDPTTVLQQLFTRNIQHFGQAAGTPFTTTPLVNKFGYVGVTFPGEKLIQDGIIPIEPSTVATPTYDVLHRLADTTRSQLIHHDLIDFESFSKSIRKWRESTSTSPSGRHLGHYKSLLSMDSNSSKYTDEDPDPCPTILKDIFHIANTAFNSGLSLERWKQVTTCMIEKLPGLPRINKLRVIHLYEADYNAFLKLAWQRGVVWRAHLSGSLNPAQAGSRPHHTSIDVVISKDQKYLNSQLTRLPMVTMDNDAKSCYDRVVASLALLISHHFGVPEEICHTVGETLRMMQFKLRTALGDSAQFYSHSDEQPIHGVGQGGTASPAMWLLVSSILFDCYQMKAAGMTMSDPTRQYSLQQWVEAIVDDTSIFTNVAKDETIVTLVKTLEQDAQYWENLLSVSGGCLELSKCFYYVLAWTFTDKGDALPMSSEEIEKLSDKIRLQEFGKSVKTTISTKQPQEAHKTLGVWKNMIGGDSTHISTLIKRSANMSSIVGTSGMHPYQAEVAVRMIYTPAMGYSLPAVNIPEKVLNKMQNKAMESFIPAMGYNKKTPQAIMYGPKEFGGANIPHLYTECRIQQITTLIMHIRSKTDLGRLFMINLNWLQLTIGVGTSLFENTDPISYVENNWFFGIRQFLQQINGKLLIPAIYLPKLERQHDQFLMGTVPSQTPAFSANQLRHINQWRLYFQVQTLSDITTARGDCILDTYLTIPTANAINQLRSDRQSKYDWPYQPPPSSKSTFLLWKRALKQCFTHPDGKTLRRSLGKWIIPSSQFQSLWQTYLTHNYTHLIERKDSTFRMYHVIIKSTSTTIIFDASAYTDIASLPEGCFPIQIHRTPISLLVSHFKQNNTVKEETRISIPKDIQQAIHKAPFWQRSLLQHFHIPDPQYLQQCLENDTNFIVVSDGGMKDGKGSFGVVAGTPSDQLYSIEGPALGNPTLMHAYRSEGYGMMASFNFLNLFVASHHVIIPTSKKVTAYCDNLSLVDIINEALTYGTYPRMHVKPDFDVIMQILDEIKALRHHKFHIIIEHIKGHQDKHIDYVNLSRPSQLNVDADHHATNYLTQGPNFQYSELPSNPISLYINDIIITRAYKSSMRSASTSPNLRAYFLLRFDWRPSIPDLIWWDIHGSSLESFTKNDRRRLRKFIFGWLPTNARLFSYKQTPDPRCPTCNTYEETHVHLLKCSHTARQTIKDKWYTSFEEFLQNARYTPPLVKQILYDHIVAETSSIQPKAIPPLPSDIQAAYNDQAQIGWHHLIQGRLALRWGNIIASHLSSGKVPEKEMSALVWGRRVVKEIFHLVLMLWHNRNNEAHGSSRNMESPLTRSRLMAQIEDLQQSNPDVEYSERDFIYRSISDLESYSLCNLKAWHKQAVTIIKVSNNRTRIASKQFRQSPAISSYFNPVRADDPANPTLPFTSDANNDTVLVNELSQ